MARTQAADYDQKRDAITSHAAHLFARHGFAGASISELANLCAVSKSLIYHYYGSKEEILFDVMDEHVNDLLDALEGVTHHDDAVEELSQLSRALLQRYTGAADSQKVLLYELSSLPEKERTEIVEKQRRLIERVEQVLLRCKPPLVKQKSQLRASVMLFFGMLNWTNTWFNASGPISRDQLADMATNMILQS